MLRFFRFLILALALCPAAAMASKVDVNTASVSALQYVYGLNLHKAHAIVGYRETHGRFNSINDLIRVPGINKRVLHKISPYITVSSPPKAKPKPAPAPQVHHHHYHHQQ